LANYFKGKKWKVGGTGRAKDTHNSAARWAALETVTRKHKARIESAAGEDNTISLARCRAIESFVFDLHFEKERKPNCAKLFGELLSLSQVWQSKQYDYCLFSKF